MNITKNTLKWIVLIGLYALLLIPFLYSPQLYFPYITTKAFLFRAIVEVIFGAWVGLAILSPKYRPKKSLILWSFISLVGVMLIANLQGVDIAKSMWSNYERMDGYVTLLHVFGLFIVAGSVFTTQKKWSSFWHTSIVLSMGHAAIALLQYFGTLSASFSQDRIDAFFGNAIYLAVFMLFHVFITLFYLLRKTHTKAYVPYLYVLAIVLQIITILLTATRGTLLGLVGGLGLAFLLIALFSKGKKVLRATAGGIIVALLLFVGIIFGAKESAFVTSVPAFNRLASISLTDNTTMARFINWGIAWDASKERPILGYGQGNYGPIYDANYDPRMWNQEQWFDRSHNVLLDWLVAGGWLGLIAYLSLFVVAVYLIANKKSTYSVIEKSVLIGLLAGYFVHNIFVFDNLTSYMMFAFLLAFIHSQSGISLLSSRVWNRKPEVLITGAIIALLVGITLVPAVNAKSFTQNIMLINNIGGKADTVETLLEKFKTGAAIDSYGQTEYRSQLVTFTSNHIIRSAGMATSTKQDFVQFTADEIVKEMQENPHDSRSFFIAGQFFAQIGNFDVAKEIFERAIVLSPKKQVLKYVYIETLVKLGEIEQAVVVAKENYELNTSNVDAWTQYVRTLSRAGDSETANQLIEASYAEEDGIKILTLLRREVDVSPENPQTYASLGTAYARVGKIDEAIATFRLLAERIPEAKAEAEAVIATLQEEGGL